MASSDDRPATLNDGLMEALAETPTHFIWHFHMYASGRVILVAPLLKTERCGTRACALVEVGNLRVIPPDPTDNPGTGG